MSPKAQWIAITGGCLAVFVFLRLLPVESCEFLHYGDYVDDNGVIEGCGYEETSFFDLSELRFPILFELVPDRPPVVGQPTQFTLMLRTTTGRAIDYENIAVTHTERLHALVVDASMDDYQHIHPEPMGPPGHFRFELTPERAGDYQVYLDFIPLTNSRRTLLAAGFSVLEADPAESQVRPPQMRGKQLLARAGDYTFELALSHETLQAGEPFEMELSLKDSAKPASQFELVMGAYAHLVAFDPARVGFAHLHPMNPIVEGQDPSWPDMRFQLELDRPGQYRVWAQVQVGGEELFLPFDLHLET